jgi:hypothetical protein
LRDVLVSNWPRPRVKGKIPRDYANVKLRR